VGDAKRPQRIRQPAHWQWGLKMATDEFKEELQRLAHVTEIRNDERVQASDRAQRLFGPIRNFLSRFNEALGAFGKIEVAGPYPVGKFQHATATITAPNGRVVSWEFVLSDGGVTYQRSPYQLSEYGRLDSQLKSDVVAFLEKVWAPFISISIARFGARPHPDAARERLRDQIRRDEILASSGVDASAHALQNQLENLIGASTVYRRVPTTTMTNAAIA
jgi:hypothetical protein